MTLTRGTVTLLFELLKDIKDASLSPNVACSIKVLLLYCTSQPIPKLQYLCACIFRIRDAIATTRNSPWRGHIMHPSDQASNYQEILNNALKTFNNKSKNLTDLKLVMTA